MSTQRSRGQRREQADVETPEQALQRLGFAGTEPVRYFPDVATVIVPGLGQVFNRRLAPFQIAKALVFAWFIWMFLSRAREGQAMGFIVAAVLVAASAADFLWTRRSYNRRLATAKEQLGMSQSSETSEDATRPLVPPSG
jgi:hypothetical protein